VKILYTPVAHKKNPEIPPMGEKEDFSWGGGRDGMAKAQEKLNGGGCILP